MRTRPVALFAAVAAAVSIVVVSAAQSSQAEAMLEAARKIEVIDGDYAAAIKQYQAIVDRFEKTDRRAAAVALLRMADAYQKLGDKQAETVLQRVVTEFKDQIAQVTEARARLATANATSGSTAIAPRLIGRVEPDWGWSHRLSADERTMVLWADVTMDLYTRDMTSGKVTRLNAQTGPGLEGGPRSAWAMAQWPVLSPDSTQIAYSWGSHETRNPQLRLMTNQPGAAPRVLVDDAELGGFVPAAWSAARQAILVAITGKAGSAGAPGRRVMLAWVSDSDGKVTPIESLDWRITPWTRPSLSPDDRFIAYSALSTNPAGPRAPRTGDTHIYVVASDGSGRVQLTNTAGTNRDPVWTADGRRLLFISDRNGTSDLWSIELRDGRPVGGPALIWRDIGGVELIGVTRAGALYYQTDRTRQRSVGIAEISSGGMRNKPATEIVGTKPAWSHDGTAIAVLRRRGASNADGFGLVVHSLRTGEETKYDRTKLVALAPFDQPIWFHDGRRLLVAAEADSDAPRSGNAGDQRQWLIVDPKAGTATRGLSPDELRVGIVGLLPDDRTLYYLGRQTSQGSADRIVAHDLLTGTRQDVVRLPVEPGFFVRRVALRPDGHVCAIETFNDDTVRLGILTVSSGAHRVLHQASSSSMGTYAIQWSGDGRLLYWSVSERTSNDAPRVMRIRADGGLLEFTGLEGFHDISPDGSQSAVETVGGPEQELWMLDVATLVGRLQSSR